MDKCDLCLWNQGSGGGGGSSTLAGLTDVDISNPTDGQTLVYDATSSKWVNGSSGGGVLALHVNTQTGALDKTWQEIYDLINAGTICFVFDSYSTESGSGLVSALAHYVEDMSVAGNGYVVACTDGTNFFAQTPNDYPARNL